MFHKIKSVFSMRNKLTILLSLILIISGLTTCKQNSNVGTNSPKISSKEILERLKNNQSVFYKNATIIGDLDFCQLDNGNYVAENTVKNYINGSITFVNCEFQGKVLAYKDDGALLHHTSFEKNLTFANCTFRDTINFSEIVVKDLVNFSGSIFAKKAYFEGATFLFKNIYFSKTIFRESANFQRAVIHGYIDFLRAIFESNVSFQNSEFSRNAQFGAAKFNAYTDFTNMTVFAGIFFNYAEFNKHLTFSNSVFYSRTEFMNCKFNITEFSKVFFYGDTKFNKSTFKDIAIFENCFFNLEKPDTKGIIIEKENNFKIVNCTYSTKSKLESFK